jgi:hypothetical protein
LGILQYINPHFPTHAFRVHYPRRIKDHDLSICSSPELKGLRGPHGVQSMEMEGSEIHSYQQLLTGLKYYCFHDIIYVYMLQDTPEPVGGSKDFMAFGGGLRLCVGADFAKLQMAMFIHCLVTKYR